MENGQLEEFTIERTTEKRIVASVFKGKIKNLEPGLKAAFVDIGFEKNAFLHYWDIIPESLDQRVDLLETPAGAPQKPQKKITQQDIPKLYPPGSEVIVQVVKGPIGTKGPRITTNISIPGRYLVLMPYNPQRRLSRGKVRLYNEPSPIFTKFNVEKQIENAFRRQVWLKSGGYICIDETEALVAIDVNTGRHKSQKDLETTIVQTNLEAADEICRQLRLRNIGGLIVIDFIDMRSRGDQQKVTNRVRDGVKRDKAKTRILNISQLGLLEMTT